MFENEKRLIIDTCKQMQTLGYFIGTWGNISMRVENCIIVTPSRVSYNNMDVSDMIVLDMDGNKIEGYRNPTSEKEVHRQIYLKRPDLNAIIHTHTEKCMAVSATNNKEVPCLVEEMSQLLGGTIPLTDHYVPAEQHEQLGLAAAEAIKGANGVILRNHGGVACGKNMEEAVLAVKVMEKSCGIFLSITPKLLIEEIPVCFVESERYRFLHLYGHENT